jgi:hypothetical protein
MATANETQITPPRVPIIDERTGAVSREWYRWFYSLYVFAGSGSGILPVIAGGTGLGTIPTNGQLLIGNGTGYTLNTLGYGVGILVTNGLGTIVVANTGVLSIIAGTGISASSTTGNVTLSNTGVLSWSGGTTGLTPATATTGAVTLAGTLVIANGGTNATATPTAGAISYGTGSAYAFTAVGTAGQVLTSAGASTPTWTTPTTGTVTAVSIVSANGFAGTSSGGATPALTLTTTITGLLKGNGTAISAAVANTDYVPLSTVITKTADYTITGTDTWIINNKTGSALTLTFPAASSWTGRYITVKNMQAQAVNSASSNIVPIDSTSAGTAVLLGVVGNWATMVSDGTNWIIMQAASNNNLLLE